MSSKMIKPKNKKLIKIITVNIVIFLIGCVIGFYVDSLLENLHEKPDIDIIMPFDIEKDYLPITVDNIGDKNLHNITVKIKSCDMDGYFISAPFDLKSKQQYVIKFKDVKTINNYKKYLHPLKYFVQF